VRTLSEDFVMNTKRLFLSAAPAAVLFAGSAFAQDTCATALPVAGFGVLAAGTTCPFTTSGFNGGGTCAAGASTINQDVFYQWVSPVTGIVVFDTFGSAYDTKLSVHAGVGCAATCVAYNDDSGGLQSAVTVCVNQGDMLLIQVGGFGAACGTYMLAANPDTICGVDDALEDNDTCATATSMCDGTTPGLFVSKCDDDYYSVTVNDGTTLAVDILFAHANGDLDLFLYDAAGCALDEGVSGHNCANSIVCGFSVTDNESIVYANTSGAAQDLIIKVNVWPATASNCNNYALVISGSRCGNNTACNPANTHCGTNTGPNPSGPAAISSSFTGPGLVHLEVVDGPAAQFGYFLVSSTITEPGASVSNGILCLNSPIGRYNPTSAMLGGNPALDSVGQFDPAGVFQNLAGTSSVGSGFDVPMQLPTPPGGVIIAGSTWYFQCWYRCGNRSNFSNAVCVLF
jgi:hypothetical protein